jgi:hypothetical protein
VPDAQRARFAGPHLNVVAAEAGQELDAILARLDEALLVADGASLRAGLAALAEGLPPAGPRTLDLIGHTVGGARLLRLGDLVLDADDPASFAPLARLRADGHLHRLTISAVRLLGCGTATTDAGRATIRALAAAVALPVHGTTQLVHAIHFGPAGLRARYQHLLVGDRALARRDPPPPPPRISEGRGA